MRQTNVSFAHKPTTQLLRWTAACVLLAGLSGCSSFSMSKLWPWGNKADAEATTTAPAQPAAEPEKAPEPEATTFAETPPSPLPAQISSPSSQVVALEPSSDKAPAKAGKPNSKAIKAGKGAESNTLVRGYYINVGLFAVAANGNNAFRKLEAAGLPVFTDIIQSRSKGTLTRVRVGPYPTQAEAEQAAKDIKNQGLDAVVFDFAGHASAAKKTSGKKAKAAAKEKPKASGKKAAPAADAKADAAQPAEKKK